MKTFEYKGYRHSGESCAGLVEALDLKAAREKLSHQGILAERVAVPSATRRSVRHLSPRHRFGLERRAAIYRELSALLQSGLPLVQALDVLLESPELEEARTILAGVRDGVREGMGTADAMAAESSSVTAFERAVLRTGEETGALGKAFGDLASFLEEHHALRESVQTALIYPTVVLALAMGIGIVMLGVMVPNIARMLEEGHVALPFITRFVIALSTWTVRLGLPILGVGLIVFIRFRHRWMQDHTFRTRTDSVLFRLPGYARGYRILVCLRFSRTLAMLLGGGVSLVEAVELAGLATGSSWTEQLVRREAQALREGEGLSDVIRRVPPLSDSLPGWIQAGEAGGVLESMLRSASERYRLRWERFVQRSLTLLEPALSLAVGLFVLLVALALLLPILSLNEALR